MVVRLSDLDVADVSGMIAAAVAVSEYKLGERGLLF